jgi:hypothetical protein
MIKRSDHIAEAEINNFINFTDINICVKDNFFLHLLDLLKLKSSGII